MCKRFTFAIDPSITDREEKEMILRSVTGFGDKSIQPVRDFLRSSDSATVWALKALSQLQSPTEVVGACVETLEKVGPDYTRDPEKKTVLLKHLLEMEDPRIVPATIPFLLDPSDDVKISASHILGKVKPPEGKKALIEGMLHEKDHKRVLAAYAEALALAGYKLDEAERLQVQPLLPDGVSIAEDGALVQK